MNLTHYLYLLGAIVAEVIGTTAMKSSDGFSRLGPSLVTVACYALAFYLLSLTLRVLPTGVAYAIWSGIGIVLVSLLGWVWHRQALNLPTVLGMGLIIAGVIVVNLFSGEAH